jgi:hypothetical protein
LFRSGLFTGRGPYIVAPMFASNRRDVARYRREHFVFPSLDVFLAAEEVPSGILTIEGPQPIDVLYSPTGGETTVVAFHAALSGTGLKLPMFAGGKVTQDWNTNRIFISDPGLYADDEVRIAWFAGTDELPLQSVLPRILEKLIDAAGGARTLFWGPSAGGFAALYYSRFFPGSLAVPINPQTILARFGYENQRRYTRAAFGAETPEQHDEVFSARICSDLRDHYAGDVPNYILYIQNSNDTHLDWHMTPFLDSLGDTHRVKKVLGSDWGVGHFAPPVEEIRRLVGSMTAPTNDWADYFAG